MALINGFNPQAVKGRLIPSTQLFLMPHNPHGYPFAETNNTLGWHKPHGVMNHPIKFRTTNGRFVPVVSLVGNIHSEPADVGVIV